jgi:hypothetical protein
MSQGQVTEPADLEPTQAGRPPRKPWKTPRVLVSELSTDVEKIPNTGETTTVGFLTYGPSS